MGEVKVPVDALWRAQTQRAVENFPISGRGLERSQIRALGLLKAAAARVNERLGVLDADLAGAIADAAQEVADGRHDDQFPIDVFQTGSGTSSNMNANEVIATLASRAARPRRAPERPRQRLAVVQRHVPDDDPRRRHRGGRPRRAPGAGTPRRRRSSSAPGSGRDVVKSGRTHLMDAVPVTLGQEAGAWAAQVRYGVERLRLVPAAAG